MTAVASKEQIEAGKGRGSRKCGAQFWSLVEWLQLEKKYDHITGTAQTKLAEVEAEVEKDGLL